MSCVQMRSNYSTILNTEFEKGPYDFINSLFKVCPMDNTITNERSNVLGYFAFVSVPGWRGVMGAFACRLGIAFLQVHAARVTRRMVDMLRS